MPQNMVDKLEGVPAFMEEEVQSRIAARGSESTFVVDESAGEVIVAYTGFTDALKREYGKACEERGEDAVNVYHLTKEGWAIQLVKYETATGTNGGVVWREERR